MATFQFTTKSGKTLKVSAPDQASADRRARDTAAETGDSIVSGSTSSSSSSSVRQPAPTSNPVRTPAPASSPTPISQEEYYIRPGETLAQYNTRIAARRGDSQVLNVPQPAATPAPAANTGSTVVVKAGDSLSKIAASMGVKVSDITGYRSGNQNLIYPGEVLTVRKVTATQTPAATVTDTQAEINRINEEANQSQQQEFTSLSQETAPTKDLSTSAKLTEKLISSLEERKDEKPPSLVEEFNKQRQALGVGVLEDELAGVDSELAKLEADYMSTLEDEENRQVGLGQVRKRQGAVELAYNREKRELMAKKTSLADRIDTKLGIISTIVSLTGQDYANSKASYDSKFNQTVQITSLIRGIEEDERNDAERAKDDARANVTVMYNLLKDGNIKYEDLDASAKTNVAKMEIQAGLPAGMFRYLQTNIKDDIVASSTREINGKKYYDVIIKGKDGALTTKSIYIGGVDVSSSSTDNTPEGKNNKTVEAFNKDVADTELRIKAGSNGQFMRTLYAKYPNIDRGDIERKVNETYPEGWDE